jgi:catechol 2,3-dioxygenase-like lactoylglutathione lyase family enzyme
MDSVAITNVAFGEGTMSNITGIRHVGIYSPDPQALAAFYRDVLGMEIVGGSGPDHPVGATAFLTSAGWSG